MSWPCTERMKRLSLPLLRYDQVDLDYFNAIGAYALGGTLKPVDLYGVAIWDQERLHGLYVRPEAQRKGVGRALMQTVASSARRAGAARLLVKAERVSTGYFERQGLPAAGSDAPYPYTYYLETASDLATASRADGNQRRVPAAADSVPLASPH